MTTYDELLEEADNNNLITKEKPLPISKGRIKGNRIAIRKDMTETEKKCVLAEELGHHYTTVGNILDQSYTENRKQELRSRIISYNRLIGLRGIVNAFNNHCQNISEAADYLDVTEEFLNECLESYKSKYGLYASVDNYIVFFEPTIAVLELI